MGVPPADCTRVGELLGTKTAANEFVAYSRLAELIRERQISRRAAVIATYALCGFANMGSLGIMVGGLSALAPTKRAVLARHVLRAMIAGTLACFATACVAGAIYDEGGEEAPGGEAALSCAAASNVTVT